MRIVDLSRVRLGAAGAATACIAVASLLASTATAAAPAAYHVRPATLFRADHNLDLVRGINSQYGAGGKITNNTPYTWTFVQQGSEGSSPQPRFGEPFPPTLAPFQSFGYGLIWTDRPYAPGNTYGYDGWFTYKAETPTGPNYLTVSLEGYYCLDFICQGSIAPLTVQVYDTSTAPSYPNGGAVDFGTPASNSGISWSSPDRDKIYNNPVTFASFDYSFQARGNYTLDASTGSGQVIGDLLNTLCANAPNTSCSFTSTNTPTYLLGKKDQTFEGAADNVDCSNPPTTRSLRRRTGAPKDVPPPPADDPDWHEVSWSQSSTTGLSVGGSVDAGVKVDIAGIVEAELSASFGVEQGWEDTTEVTKSVRVYLPLNYIGGVWSVPEVGTVVGKLVVSLGGATYTITNFAATKPGVSPNLARPPYDILTYTRPLTLAEWQIEHKAKCPSSSAAPPEVGAPSPHVHVTG